MADNDLLRRFADKLPLQRLLDGSVGGLSVGGVVGSMATLLAAALNTRTRRTVLLVLASEEEAEDASAELALHMPNATVVHLPSGHADAVLRVRRALMLAPGTLLVSACRALSEGFCSSTAAADATLRLQLGGKGLRDDLVARLVAAGFGRESVVERCNTFAVRGDLVDFMPEGEDLALRVEFDDECVEGLRRFDPATQVSNGSLERLEVLLGLPAHSVESLATLLPPDALVVRKDELRCREALTLHCSRLQPDDAVAAHARYEALARFPLLLTSSLAVGSSGVDLGGKAIAADGASFESAVTTLERVARGKDRVLLVFDAAGERQRFLSLLPTDAAWSGSLQACEGRLLGGFHAPAFGLAACGHSDLFLTQVRRRRAGAGLAAPAPPTRPIDTFLDLREGDTVVHGVHGIARFLGLERVDKDGAQQDHLRLLFADDITLLVPAVRIDLVQKYVGGRGATPELGKLGGSAWGKRKEQVAAGVLELAAGLIEVQALRAARRGQAHGLDTPWQLEFETSFPHVLTGDQQRAMEDIKRDMETPRPMDRLLCGDVGYGKTELAMRAAFKCAMGGRQTVVLVPTTLLAQQHAATMRDRMAPWPVRVECLSRFRTDKEVREILEATASGGVDVLIGTHRLMGADVKFHDLGMLVIDEEQRFGVAHKEKLRRLRSDVDVLTMTATPIPRTLHQSMLGIRDISSLQEPPRGRREVETRVGSFNAAEVRSAILRELDRQGQVFFVHNRVRSIDRVAAKLQEIVPEARVIVGHGQMSAGELEDTMMTFLERRADVLVATTIVESGIDIPSANTMFVDEAQDYGLADLHQLRGRVGRSHLQAFAWFLVAPDKMVGEDATRRLAAIEEFSHLGAGFRIAVRDLEIRGAGNLLGSEQSGHIASVGYEMYCRLLDAAVKKMKHAVPEVEVEAELDLAFTACLPEAWIRDRRLRVEAYRRYSRARTEVEFQALSAEFEDRFGTAPSEVKEFEGLARLRALLVHERVQRLWLIPGEGVALACNPAAVGQRIGLPPARVRAVQGRTLLLVTAEHFDSAAKLLAFMRRAFAPSFTGQRHG
ncbi:MAG: transcription-repair coupling factor [Planctomycetes bacterium]|nr:transcription-repair coupling factor [Planctomycetota bacterium]